MKLVTRQEWGARAPRDKTYQRTTDIKTIFIHHSESQGGQRTFNEQAQAIRNTQDFHMGPERQWSDIAYTYLVTNPFRGGRSRAFVGRGLHQVPAAQLGFNTNSCAICVITMDGEPLSWKTKLTLRRLIWQTRRRIGRQVPVKPHSAVNSTSCPGDQLRAWIKKHYG